MSFSNLKLSCIVLQPQEAPPQQEEAPPQQEEVPQPEPKGEAPPAQEPSGKTELGESIGVKVINPLDFVKTAPPLLSQAKKKAPERALGSLEDAAARDETCVWQRVSNCCSAALCSSCILQCHLATDHLCCKPVNQSVAEVIGMTHRISRSKT